MTKIGLQYAEYSLLYVLPISSTCLSLVPFFNQVSKGYLHYENLTKMSSLGGYFYPRQAVP